MSYTFGVIDIGSNTIRMNVYEIQNPVLPENEAQEASPAPDFSLIFSQGVFAGLISYVTNQKLSREGMDRLCEVLMQDKASLQALHVDQFAAFATASLRNIENTQEVLAYVWQKTGIEIDLLSGAAEGRLSWKGALNSIKTRSGVFVDTGGGSSEMIVFKDQEIALTASMPIGSLNLFTQYVGSILPKSDEVQQMKERVQKELQIIAPVRQDVHCECLCVAGGGMRAVRTLMIKLKWITPDAWGFSANLLEDLLKEILSDPRRISRLILQSTPERIHTLCGSLIIILETARYTGACRIEICSTGLREGYAAEKLTYDHQ